MKSLAWIGVLEEMRAVEIGEAVLVRGEMRRHPVEDYADIRLMQLVDQILEVLRRAVAARRREIAGALIAPRPIERMLHDRQQLDVREIHLLHVVDERLGDVAVTERLIVVRATPGAEVDFVDRHRSVEAVALLALPDPFR